MKFGFVMVVLTSLLLLGAALVISASDTLTLSCDKNHLNVSETLSCNLAASFKCHDVSLTVDFGDGSISTLTGIGNPINPNYGEVVPVFIASPYAKQPAVSATYLLLNTELLVDSYVKAMEFYSISGGYMGINIAEFNMSLTTTTTVAYFKDKGYTPTTLNYTTLYQSDTPDTGYHLINFTTTKVFPRGSMVYLYSESSSTLAINQASSNTYSDCNWQTNEYLTTGSPNWAFYLKLYTEPVNPAYQQTTIAFPLSKSYSAGGSFNIVAKSLLCLGSEVEVNQTIEVSQPTSTSTSSSTTTSSTSTTTSVTKTTSTASTTSSTTTTLTSAMAISSTTTSTLTSASLTSSTKTTWTPSGSVLLKCSSSISNIYVTLMYTIQVSYSCLNATIKTDFHDGLYSSTWHPTPSTLPGIITNSTRIEVRSYFVTGIYPVVSVFYCDGAITSAQLILWITDGAKESHPN